MSRCYRGAADADVVVGRKRRGGAVWEDPDDADVEVAVAGRPRLRKLRHTEDEAVLSGELPASGHLMIGARCCSADCGVGLSGSPETAAPACFITPAGCRVHHHGSASLIRPTHERLHSAGEKYEQRLRAQHTKLNPRTAWAKRRAGDSLEDAEGDLTAGGALARPSRLPKGTIEVP